MTNAETWTEIQNFCHFLYETEFNLFSISKFREFCPGSHRSRPVSSTPPWTTLISQVGFEEPP